MNFSVLILYLYTDYNIIQGILFEKNCIAYFTKKLILYYYILYTLLLLRLKYIDTHKRKKTLHILIEFNEPVFALTET